MVALAPRRIAFVLLGVCGLLNAARGADASAAPNILFLLSDDHSVPFPDCYGSRDVQTSNLDRLAAEGAYELLEHLARQPLNTSFAAKVY